MNRYAWERRDGENHNGEKEHEFHVFDRRAGSDETYALCWSADAANAVVSALNYVENLRMERVARGATLTEASAT